MSPRTPSPITCPDELHEDNLAYIVEREVRAAYLYLVRFAERLPGYRCGPTMKGVIRVFRYWEGDEQPFALMVNQGSLLFYFRKPAVARGLGNPRELARVFRDVYSPRSGETTVRIENVDDARTLMQIVFSDLDAVRDFDAPLPSAQRAKAAAPWQGDGEAVMTPDDIRSFIAREYPALDAIERHNPDGWSFYHRPLSGQSQWTRIIRAVRRPTGGATLLKLAVSSLQDGVEQELEFRGGEEVLRELVEGELRRFEALAGCEQ